MRIAVLSRDWPAEGRSRRHTGVGRYSADLVQGLRQLGHDAHPLGAGARPGLAGWLAIRSAVGRLRPGLTVIADPALHGPAAALPPRAPWAPVFYGTDAIALREAASYRGAGPLRRLRRTHLLRYITEAAERIVISNYAAEELRRTLLAGGAPSGIQVRLVYPAVSAAYTMSKPVPEPADDVLRVVTIGRISERKNQLGTLRALAQLALGQGIAFHYTVVGNVDGPVHLAAAGALRQLVAAEGLGHAVTLVEEATDQEAAALLDSSHLCAALSVAAGASVEGFGITALEAAARARPALVSAHGGMREAVVHEQTGLVADTSDEAAVCAAFARLARDGAERRRMGAAGRERAVTGFTPGSMAEALLA